MRDGTDTNTSTAHRRPTKSVWTRERPVTRSLQYEHAISRDIHQTLEVDLVVVNNVNDVDSSNYREAIQSADKSEWKTAMQEELQALEANQVWNMVATPDNASRLHTK